MNRALPWRGQGTKNHRPGNRRHPGDRHGGLGRQDQRPDARVPLPFARLIPSRQYIAATPMEVIDA